MAKLECDVEKIMATWKDLRVLHERYEISSVDDFTTEEIRRQHRTVVSALNNLITACELSKEDFAEYYEPALGGYRKKRR